jgi:hypothetical protein
MATTLESTDFLFSLSQDLSDVLADPIDADKPEPVYVWASHCTLASHVVKLPLDECRVLVRSGEALRCGFSFTEAAEETQNNLHRILNSVSSSDFVVMCAVHTAEYLIERNASK